MSIYIEPDPDAPPAPTFTQQANKVSSWLPNSGGCLNSVSWRQNPQFELILGAESGHASSGTQCNLQVQISRPTTSTVKVSIGLYIVPRYQNTPIPVTALNYAIMSGQLFKVPFSENPSTKAEFFLAAGSYILIPCTFRPLPETLSEPLHFKLNVLSNDASVRLDALPALPQSIRCTGSWVNPTPQNVKDGRFSFHSDSNTKVLVWLSADDRVRNPEPQFHVWKFKLKENVDYIRSNGEIIAQLNIQANTPYFVTATSSARDTLGSFQLLLASDQPIEVDDANISEIPSSLEVLSTSNSANTLPASPQPRRVEITESRAATLGFADDLRNVQPPQNTRSSPAVVKQLHTPFANDFDDSLPPPPPPPDENDSFSSKGHSTPLVPASGRSAVVFSNANAPPFVVPLEVKAPGTPMSRGKIIESYADPSPHPTIIPANFRATPPPSPQRMDPRTADGRDHRSGSGTALSPHMAARMGNQPVESIKMATLPFVEDSPRPPSLAFVEPPLRRNSVSALSDVSTSAGSHAMHFSMESQSSVSSLTASYTEADNSRSVPMIPQETLSCTIRFTWKGASAGGNARTSSWRQNQQWRLDVHKAAFVTFSLAQLGNQPPASVGVYVLRSSPYGPLRRIQIDDEEQKATTFEDVPTYVRTLEMPIGRYIIIPCTETPGVEREAILTVKSSQPGEIGLQTLPDNWACITEEGEWDKETAGGCWTEISWSKNPQYQVTFKRRAAVTIVLSLPQPLPTPIGFYVVRNTSSFKTVLEITPENLIFPVQFRQRTEIVKTVQGSDNEIFNIVPATFTANQLSKFTLSIYTSEPGLVTVEDVSKYTERLDFSSHWKTTAAGGTFDHPSWRHNEQLHACWRWTGNMQVGIVISQQPRPKSSDESKDASPDPSKASSSAKDEATLAKKEDISKNATNPGRAITSSAPLEYGADDASEDIEPFGFYVYPLEDPKIKRVLIERQELLMTPVFGPARRVSGVLALNALQPLVVDSDGNGHLVINPFTVNQFVQRDTDYEVRVFLQSDSPNYRGSSKIRPTLTSVTQHPMSFSHRGEWIDPLAAAPSTPPISKEHESKSQSQISAALASTAGVKLLRAEMRKFQVLEPNTALIILLLQKSFCLGEIQVYKLGNVPPGQSLGSGKAVKTSQEKKEEGVVLLLNHSTLLHRSKISRSHENTLKCTIAEPGFYVVCGVPEVPESVGAILMVVHHSKPVKDLNIDTSSSSEKTAKRVRVIEEILMTERVYVKNLRVMVDHFMSKLISQAVDLGVNVDDLKKIFSNIPTLLNCNTAFLDQLTATADTKEFAIGRVFSDFCNFFRMYAEYTNHFDTNCRLLEGLKKKSAFKTALLNLENDPIANRLNFNDFYICPVQRIPRYSMLLEQLLKYTEENNPDYPSLVQSLDRVKSVAFDINEKKRRAEAEAQVVQIQNTIFYKNSKDHPLIAVPARLFIRSGACTLTQIGSGDATTPPTPSKKKPQPKPGALPFDTSALELAYSSDHIFLFNDTVILTKAKKSSQKKTFIWKHQIPLTSDSDVSSFDSKAFCLRTPITTSTTVTYFFEMQSTADRDLWVSELSVIIQILVNSAHLKLASKVNTNWKVLDSKMQMLLPS